MDNVILILAVLMLSASQLLQKMGADRSLGSAVTARDWLAALCTPTLLLAVALIVSGTLLWLYVLYRMDVSRAYPFLGLGTVVVVSMSRIFLREVVSGARWFGVVLIVIGIALIART